MKCKYKESCGYEYCLGDCCPEYEAAIETKADRIRAMSDAELANIVVCPHCKTNWDKCTDDCFACRLEWLRQPAEGADNG